MRGGLGKCIWPLEIDYSKQTLYWVNTCVDVLRSLQISDAVQSADRVEIESSFEGTSSMTLFENVLYWNEDNVVKATNKSVEMGEIVQLYQVSSLGPAVTAVELVHPGKQPQGTGLEFKIEFCIMYSSLTTAQDQQLLIVHLLVVNWW